MINTSEQINEIAAALAKAQAEMENVAKDRENPHFRSRYATLGGVLAEVRPKLAAQGISIWQSPINGDGPSIGVTTRLLHSSGQWLESTIFVAPLKFDVQGVGSVLTYLRRYSLMAIAGVGPEDDDGEAAAISRPQDRARPEQRGPAARSDHPRKADAEDAYKRIRTAINAAIRPDMIDELIKANSDSFLPLIKEVSEQHYDLLMTAANARKSEMFSVA
jgi:hypothetical protein